MVFCSVIKVWHEIGDIVCNILERIPAENLQELRLVSKFWSDVISDPIFIRNQMLKCNDISGFLIQNMDESCVASVGYIPYGASIYPVQFDHLNFLPSETSILFVDHGFVCTRSFSFIGLQQIFISNLLTKCSARIVCPNDLPMNCGLVFVMQDFHSSCDVIFKYLSVAVTIVDVDVDQVTFVFDTYCSISHSWQRVVSSCSSSWDAVRGRAVAVDYIVYWLTHRNGLLMFDAECSLAGFVPWPLPSNLYTWCVPETCLGKVSGKLYCTIISEHGLQVRVLLQPYIPTWDPLFGISLLDLSDRHPYTLFDLQGRIMHLTSEPIVEPVGFINDLVVLRVSNALYVYYYKTDTLKRLGRLRGLRLQPRSMYSNIVMPYFGNVLRLLEY